MNYLFLVVPLADYALVNPHCYHNRHARVKNLMAIRPVVFRAKVSRRGVGSNFIFITIILVVVSPLFVDLAPHGEQIPHPCHHL